MKKCAEDQLMLFCKPICKIRFRSEYKVKIMSSKANWFQGLLLQLIFVKPNLQMHPICVTLPQMHRVFQECDVSWNTNMNVIKGLNTIESTKHRSNFSDKCDMMLLAPLTELKALGKARASGCSVWTGYTLLSTGKRMAKCIFRVCMFHCILKGP